MTNEDAIHALDTLVEAYGVAIRALRAQLDVKCLEIDTVKSANVDRSRWDGCCWCTGFCPEVTGDPHWDYRFCPKCGRPLTDGAWAELERRINDGTTDMETWP